MKKLKSKKLTTTTSHQKTNLLIENDGTDSKKELVPDFISGEAKINNLISNNNNNNNNDVVVVDDKDRNDQHTISIAKPNIFHYHQYLEFLKDWFAYQKSAKKGFSLRHVAKECEIATGYLPMILSEKRPLSVDVLRKIIKYMQLSKSEKEFFELIHILGTTNSQELRAETLEQMKKFKKYREHNPRETETYEYLTRWYYYTIRELSADPEFQLDAAWIQKRLILNIPLKEINDAIEFLIQNKYIEVGENGKVTPPQKHINCSGGIYRIALTQYHKQLFRLAEKSIENTEPTERHILGHTFAIPSSNFNEVRQIIDDAIAKVQKISNLADPNKKDSVYHMEMALFPLTKKNGSTHE